VGVEIGQCSRQVIDGAEQQMLDGTCRCFDRRGRQRCLASGREDDAVNPCRFSAPEERPDVLRVFKRVEDEDERRLTAFGCTRKDLLRRRVPTRIDDERDPLMAIEARQRRQRSALDLDDRDTQTGSMEDELFEGAPSLRNDDQAVCGPTRRERLFDGAPTRDELLVGAEQVRRGERWRRPRPRTGFRPLGRAGGGRPAPVLTRPPAGLTVRAATP
jgi:hypothetical protein